MFDSTPERNPSDEERAQFYNAILEDNLTFDEVNIRYELKTPNVPNRVLTLNMGTKKT